MVTDNKMVKKVMVKKRLTCDWQCGAGDVWATDDTVISLVTCLDILDLQQMAITHYFNIIFTAVLKLLWIFVPRQCDFWVVDLNFTLKHSLCVNFGSLIFDVINQSNGL